ncbi:MAG: hypothetical protein HZA90_22285 [Verrucomicrobia bacterium]|nr:hypothetical protein [Verrucomicrobiota bacterium]
MKINDFKTSVGVFSLLLLFPVLSEAASKLTFDNQSGKPALVKLVGLTVSSVSVENGKAVSVSVGSGHYYIKVRYGASGTYSYSKGDEFDVAETATVESHITITLHKVVAGNYNSKQISEQEFEGQESKQSVVAESQTPRRKSESAIQVTSSQIVLLVEGNHFPDVGSTQDWIVEDLIKFLTNDRGVTVLLDRKYIEVEAKRPQRVSEEDSFYPYYVKYLNESLQRGRFASQEFQQLFEDHKRHKNAKLIDYIPFGGSCLSPKVGLAPAGESDAPRIVIKLKWRSERYGNAVFGAIEILGCDCELQVWHKAEKIYEKSIPARFATEEGSLGSPRSRTKQDLESELRNLIPRLTVPK